MTKEEALNEIKSWDFLEGKEIEAIETLIPELAESEDERIRKRLIEYFEGFRMGNAEVKWEGLTVQEVLAWLEKQKEQKPAYEQFPPLEGLDAIKAKYYDDGFKNGFDEGVESVKPAEWSAKGRRGRIGSTPEHIRKKAENFLSKMEPPYDADDICSAYETGAMESIKPEWNEEDEEMLNSCISSIEEAKENRYAYKETDGDTSYDHEIAWLKSLSLNLKKKNEDVAKLCSNEWSEEDERIRKAILGFVNPDKGGTKYSSNAELVEWSNWLQSLRPVSKESLQPHWKPSEDGCRSIVA